MPTVPWAIPAGKAIVGSTFIKDTDNNLSDTIDDLVKWTNSLDPYLTTGLVQDFVRVIDAQSISGIKTFTDNIAAVSGVTGNLTGNVTGNADTATLAAVATTLEALSADRIKLDGIAPLATIDQTPAEILAALLTVDGTASGLDADLLDGHDSTYFAQLKGTATVYGGAKFSLSGSTLTITTT